MHKKWIINNGFLIVGHVDFHKDFLKDNTLTIGGGWWHLDPQKGVLFLYGRSQDFGQVTKEDVEDTNKRPSMRKYEVFFSLKDNFEDVLKEYELKTKVNDNI